MQQVKYASQISIKTNCLFATAVSSRQNKKYPNEDRKRLFLLGSGLGRFVRRYNHCKYSDCKLSECDNKEKSKAAT